LLEKIKASGFLLMGLSVFLYSLCEALEKYLTKVYEPSQIIFFRSSIGILFALWIFFKKGMQAYKHDLFLHIFRNIFAAGALFLSIYSLKNLPLSSYEFMTFTAPVFIAMLSSLFLKEKLSRLIFISMGFSFVGALSMSYPFKDMSLNLGFVFAFFSTFAYASSVVITKRIAHLDNLILYSTYILTCFIMSGLFSSAHLSMQLKDLPLFILVAFIHFLAFQCLIFAFRKEELVKLSPLEYTSAAWSIVLGYLFWRYIPSLKELYGGILIILGSIIIKREKIKIIIIDKYRKIFQ
jgi:drug/metabolite transporter (DMT)-like permease